MAEGIRHDLAGEEPKVVDPTLGLGGLDDGAHDQVASDGDRFRFGWDLERNLHRHSVTLTRSGSFRRSLIRPTHRGAREPADEHPQTQ